MCGIVGIIHKDEQAPPPSKIQLTNMMQSIKYRGPDEYGMYRDHHAGLGHARLSLIDLATGQQPMANEDESLWIVFNGEIFNYIELRKDLCSRGHKFRTQSDTEVILHAYEEWGNSCFSKFNGQWAIALWNVKERSLVLSRDRVGVRPLFVYEDLHMIVFASEMKALFTLPSVPREIDIHGLEQTFTYWSPIAPTTMFRNVESVLPGTVRTYKGNGTKSEDRYWRYSFRRKEFSSFQDASHQLHEHLEEATRLRMLRADVPVGSYLSGGLDSSIVAKLGRSSKTGVFQTFSLRFTDNEFDETPYQRLMADTIDSNHQEVVVTRNDISNIFPEVIRHTEQPILRTAPAPLYLLSKLVRDTGIKAVLTGEGADEMFAGYDIFREAKIRMFWSHQPNSRWRAKLFERLYPYLARSPQSTKGIALEFWRQGLEETASPGYSHNPRWRTTSALKKYFSSDVKASIASNPMVGVTQSLPTDYFRWDILEQAQYWEVETLLSGYLLSAQGDRMLMANSVEGRFPFLDAKVIEFASSLPIEYKLLGLNEKRILKEMARSLIPAEIVQRQKQPYRAPDAACFIGADMPAYVEELFSEQALTSFNLFSPKMARALFLKCRSKGAQNLFSNSDNMAFVGILSTQLLYRCMIEEHEQPEARVLSLKTDIDRTISTNVTGK